MKTKLFLSIFFTITITLSLYAQGAREPILLNPNSGDSLNLGTGTAIIKIYGSSTQNQYSQLELIEYPPYDTPLHLHEQSDEVFYVIEGTITFFINGEIRDFKEGSIVLIPRNTPHAQGNFTDEKVRVLITLSPSGFENFFVERSAIVKEHPPGTEEYNRRMMELGKTFDIRVLGASPFD